MTILPFSQPLRSLDQRWNLSTPKARNIIDEFKRQMALGMLGDPSGSLAMIKTFVPKTEHFYPGTYIGLDLSGTNLRIVVLTINQNQKLIDTPSIQLYRIPSHLKKKSWGRESTSRDLFRFVASCLVRTLADKTLKDIRLRVGFTFAFPTHMIAVDQGILLRWTKEWDLPDLVGQDPVQGLTSSCHAIGLTGLKINALVNDTVGTLILGYFQDRRTLAGGILGTGTNLASWLDDMAINFECGNFDFGFLKNQILTSVDRELDSQSLDPGKQLFEKMVAGRYLGDLLRRLLIKFAPAESPYKQDSVTAFDLSQLVADKGDLLETQNFLERLGLQDNQLEVRELTVSLARIILKRSAQLIALAMVATVEYVDPSLKRSHILTVDGSLFEHAPGYPEIMRHVFQDFFGSRSNQVECCLVKDGSGIGAALAASAVEARTSGNTL